MSRSFRRNDDFGFDVSDSPTDGERTDRMKKRQAIPKLCGKAVDGGGLCNRSPNHIGRCRDDFRPNSVTE